MYNALKYAEELEKVGFTAEQAQTSMKVLTEVMNENFATKADLEKLGIELRSEMKQLGMELRSEMKDLRSEMRELEYRLIIKMGTMMTIGFGVMTTVLKLTHTV